MAFLTPSKRQDIHYGSHYRSVTQLGVDSSEGLNTEETQCPVESQLGRVHYDKEDHTTMHDELERKSVDYIDNKLLEEPTDRQSAEAASAKGSDANDGSQYFNWEKVRDNGNMLSDEVVKSVDSTGSKELEKGERPTVSGHGTDAILNLEEYPINVNSGRLNEWCPSWKEGEKVMSFFPIIVDQYSLVPSPLQLGYEEPVIFRGKYVDMTFNSVLDTLDIPGKDPKQIYGMCFINPTSGQLAPLAVYAELLSKEAFVDGGGERIKVTGRVLGRVVIHKIVMEEPFIKAKIIPIEDDPNFTNAEEVPKIVDEITNLHENCNKIECEIMEMLHQPYAVARIKARPNLHDLIDQRLNHFNVDLAKGPQAFAQIAAYTAFDYHLTADERYDALSMQNSFDRLRFVRDNLRLKLKQLNILKKAPRDKLDEIVDQMKNMQLNRDDAYAQIAKEVQNDTEEEVESEEQ
ncbi:uncharacterized protein BXIN_0028 [Babesia sp. Xinjiang]|uniref:uncharacterized protein n=1 Tax=Babesia sp. Xinjiang TaxID=462227 RepID=UPI000A25010B|nr:uncharacterized protein BXIN_0028 [Babesia sp. Xinjiang]ORM39748.1 hypothetical protein BXIN_0028 [Babesia sp. Xinjiang]